MFNTFCDVIQLIVAAKCSCSLLYVWNILVPSRKRFITLGSREVLESSKFHVLEFVLWTKANKKKSEQYCNYFAVEKLRNLYYISTGYFTKKSVAQQFMFSIPKWVWKASLFDLPLPATAQFGTISKWGQNA